MSQTILLDFAAPNVVGFETRLWVDIRPKVEGYSCRMMTRAKRTNDSAMEKERVALLQGTLDLLILQTLSSGPHHGQGIARTIQRQSEEAFFVDHGALYLALQRVEDKSWVSAKWGVSDNNRKARFYTLTSKGRAELASRTKQWHRLVNAIGLILRPQE